MQGNRKVAARFLHHHRLLVPEETGEKRQNVLFKIWTGKKEKRKIRKDVAVSH